MVPTFSLGSDLPFNNTMAIDKDPVDEGIHNQGTTFNRECLSRLCVHTMPLFRNQRVYEQQMTIAEFAPEREGAGWMMEKYATFAIAF